MKIKYGFTKKINWMLRIRFAKQYYSILAALAMILQKLSGWVGTQYTKNWSLIGNSWFDHRFDYLRGIDNYHWYERVILAEPRIKRGGSILDIGCGDGIYSGLFYSRFADTILAIDVDRNAISHAKNLYKKKNVEFLKLGVRECLKKNKKYDTVLMFALIEHLTEEKGLAILKKIGKRLKRDGVLFGSTPFFKDRSLHNFEHKNEFYSRKKLVLFLKKAFKKVITIESKWEGDRTECYFECSNPLND